MIGNDMMRWKWNESLHSLRSVFNGEFSNAIDWLKHKAAVVYSFPRRIKSIRLARINQIVYTPINNYSFVCLLLLHGRPVGQVLNLFSPAIAFCLASCFFFFVGSDPRLSGMEEQLYQWLAPFTCCHTIFRQCVLRKIIHKTNDNQHKLAGW